MNNFVYELGETFTGTHAELKKFILAAYVEGIDVQMISHDTAQVITVWLADEPLEELKVVEQPAPSAKALLGVVEPPAAFFQVDPAPVSDPKPEKSPPFSTKKKN